MNTNMRVVIIVITTTIVCHSCQNKTSDNMTAVRQTLPETARLSIDKNTKEITIQLEPEGKWALYTASSAEVLDTLQHPAFQGDGTPVTLHMTTPRRMYYKLVTPTETNLFSERHLPMAGGYNFRDLGGIPTADGRFVKWGKIFRSDDLHHLTEADLLYLSSIPVVNVVDFRSQNEIAAAPDKLPGSTRHVHELTIDPGSVQSLVNFSTLDSSQLDSLMTQIYVHLVTAPAAIDRYRRFFELLQDTTRTPLLFHCSAGKDRTGTAAALVLYALGVSEETILNDYLASNHYLGDKYAKELEKNPALQSVLTVKREFLQAAIDRIKQDHGSVKSFLEQELNVDIPRFKELYLY